MECYEAPELTERNAWLSKDAKKLSIEPYDLLSRAKHEYV